jgi:hypothetical protein
MSDAAAPLDAPPTSCDRDTAAQLNRECFCITLDQDALRAALQDEAQDPDFYAHLIETRPHLFSRAPVFLPRADGEAMAAVVRAAEAAARLPGFVDAARAWTPEIARLDRGPRGAFMGYDFHLGADGPKLIEINTNAGGAFLNAFLARAQIACCAEVEQALARDQLSGFEDAVMAMFAEERRLQTGDGALARVAIVDDAPREQYLYPEFVLAQRMFARRGVEALIVDPSALRHEDGALRIDGRPIDLIYNRLVDFALDEPGHAALRSAYLAGAVVVTPNPHNHARLADKRNLTLLADQRALAAWGLAPEHLAALAGAPRAILVSAANADALWAARKEYFFKPASGHGGKAVYRGDKITRSAWRSVIEGAYVAQEFAPPGERMIALGEERVGRKVDVRLYTYTGEKLLAAARLYQGQTTNFRTPGGGFAPVFFV